MYLYPRSIGNLQQKQAIYSITFQAAHLNTRSVRPIRLLHQAIAFAAEASVSPFEALNLGGERASLQHRQHCTMNPVKQSHTRPSHPQQKHPFPPPTHRTKLALSPSTPFRTKTMQLQQSNLVSSPLATLSPSLLSHRSPRCTRLNRRSTAD